MIYGSMMDKNAKIYVAGHRGLVGSAIVRKLISDGFQNIVTRTHSELDLTRQSDTVAFFEAEKPEYVFAAAALVGGILANVKRQARFLMENLQITCNIVDYAARFGVNKLLYLGSSCVYPKNAEQPIREDALLTGLPEPTNDGYATAKIAGMKLCEHYRQQYGVDFVSLVPCNLYGPHDNFSLTDAHMLPALIRKFHEAKTNRAASVTVWGTGKVYRELLHTDDLASACVLVMNCVTDTGMLNVGSGEEYTVADIASMVKEVVGYSGDIVYDPKKPDGVFRKMVDSSQIKLLGWKPRITLREGIRQTYDWYKRQAGVIRR